MALKDLFGDNRLSYFHDFDGVALWYITDTGFKFPVSCDYPPRGRLRAVENTKLFIREIRTHLQFISSQTQVVEAPAAAHSCAINPLTGQCTSCASYLKEVIRLTHTCVIPGMVGCCDACDCGIPLMLTTS